MNVTSSRWISQKDCKADEPKDTLNSIINCKELRDDSKSGILIFDNALFDAVASISNTSLIIYPECKFLEERAINLYESFIDMCRKHDITLPEVIFFNKDLDIINFSLIKQIIEKNKYEEFKNYIPNYEAKYSNLFECIAETVSRPTLILLTLDGYKFYKYSPRLTIELLMLICMPKSAMSYATRVCKSVVSTEFVKCLITQVYPALEFVYLSQIINTVDKLEFTAACKSYIRAEKYE